MKDCIILGEFPQEKIKSAIRSVEEVLFLIEVDLTMVQWPLKAGELERYSSPVSKVGHQWVICEEKDCDTLKHLFSLKTEI